MMSTILHFMVNSSIYRDSTKLMVIETFSNSKHQIYKQDSKIPRFPAWESWNLAQLRQLFKTGEHGGIELVEQPLPHQCKPCHNCVKPKGSVLENTYGYAVATSTEKRGFVTSEFSEQPDCGCSMVLGEVGQTARLTARRIPCFQYLVHPNSLKTDRVGFKSRYGARSMTTVIHLASRRAAPMSLMDTTNPEVIQLHAQAENALATALHFLRQKDFSPQSLQMATGRAIRAATLLKRATQEQKGGAL